MRSSNENGRHPGVVPEISCGRVLASHESTWLLYRSPEFQRFVDSGIIHTSLDSTQHAPVTALMRRVRANVEVACLRTTGGTSRKARPSNAREVTMTMREYEERFRPSAPPLHQTFAEVRRPSRGGRRSRRLWVMAALFGVMTITSKAALHHSSHANDWQISKAGIQACDFIHR